MRRSTTTSTQASDLPTSPSFHDLPSPSRDALRAHLTSPQATTASESRLWSLPLSPSPTRHSCSSRRVAMRPSISILWPRRPSRHSSWSSHPPSSSPSTASIQASPRSTSPCAHPPPDTHTRHVHVVHPSLPGRPHTPFHISLGATWQVRAALCLGAMLRRAAYLQRAADATGGGWPMDDSQCPCRRVRKGPREHVGGLPSALDSLGPRGGRRAGRRPTAAADARLGSGSGR